MRRIIKYHKGSVWIVKLPTVENGTHLTTKTRPCIIVSNDTGNYYSPNVMVVPCTSSENKPNLPTHYEVMLNDTKSTALTEEIRTVPKTVCLSYAGTLNETEIKELNSCLMKALDIDNEVPEKPIDTIQTYTPRTKYTKEFKEELLKYRTNHNLDDTAKHFNKTKEQISKLTWRFKQEQSMKH